MMNMQYLGFYEEYMEEDKVNRVEGRPFTQGQAKYYHDLCKQRNMNPEDLNGKTYDEVSDMIKKLTSFYPATKPQIDLINDKVGVIERILERLNFNDEQISRFEQDTENLSHVIIAAILRGTLDLPAITKDLTGGKSGTASELIGKLIIAEKYFDELEPPTENQIKTIVGMFYCPDVNFESYGIETRVVLDEKEGLWRKPTPQEFAENILKVMNKKSASDFINTNSTKFGEWKKTRIRPEQLRYIRNLEKQLGNDSKLREVRQAVDENGNIIEVGKSANVQVEGQAYVPYNDEQLIQLSIDDASKFINQLKSEISRKEEYSLEDNIEETSRGIHTLEERREKDYEVLDNMMYKLEAIAGYKDENLHHAANYHLVVDTDDEKENADYIRCFIKEMIKNEAITYYGLMTLAEESVILQKILLDM